MKNLESKYFWVLDVTPSINVTRNLLVKKQDDEVCHLLIIPEMSTNDFKLGSKGGLPNRVIASDTPSFGFDQKTIVFELNKSTEKYSPITCKQVNKNKVVNCTELF
ncbi:hypothetical protein [Iodobacter ciconiae]|uniref:Uncharacterized protein n=1 Tax=Iodobacter ciconiae TaxID=2496266 RepID=A0A3S8ZWP2_9NEIS|nr:hypothetical protein [Iodobacter ciconiae]AZN37891.1 hypothetical protein EJO50_16315 [Iodobacter ciconiae]